MKINNIFLFSYFFSLLDVSCGKNCNKKKFSKVIHFKFLTEFKKIRKKNPNFINLCLNKKLINEISQQPIKRFDLDGIILFSDILIIPYGLGQKVIFKKNIGPILGKLNLESIINTKESDFIYKINR